VIVDLGFSRDLAAPAWTGGEVTGVIAPGPRLVADPPLAGLEAMTRPDPGELPNNHLAYAGQWFFFALTALVIYVLALRRRRR
jgi:surfeit locus 1 family protein